MSGLGKQKALARRIERELEVEGWMEREKGKAEEVNFGCSCRPIHCEPRFHIGALILRVPDPHCLIHGTPPKAFADMTGAELLEALRRPL